MSPTAETDSYHPGQNFEDDGTSTIQPSLHFSDNSESEGDDEDGEEHTGDYSTRMEELFDDGEEGSLSAHEEEDNDEGFLYTGLDAPGQPSGYRDQLRDVLGHDLDEDEELDAHEVEQSLILDDLETSGDDEPLVVRALSSNICVSDTGFRVVMPFRTTHHQPHQWSIHTPRLHREWIPLGSVARLRNRFYIQRSPDFGRTLLMRHNCSLVEVRERQTRTC